MRRSQNKSIPRTKGTPAAVTSKFQSIQKTIAKAAAPRKASSMGVRGVAAVTRGPAFTATAVAAAPQDLNKDQRVAIMEADAAAASKIAAEVEDRTASPDPVEAARALTVLIDAKNTRDDLAENLAFLRGKDAFKPIVAADIQHLDELADIIDARIKASALVNATLAVLTETIRSATTIGQILDERP